MLRINCAASKNVEEMLLNIFDEFVQELTRVDNTSTVLHWKSINKTKENIL
jgi:hypothetical protein